MTQEEKQLVLKDLCARLPYKVIVDYSHNAFDVHNGDYIKHGSKCILNCHLLNVFISPRQNEKGEYIKPYLRPMSSMTEDEVKEFYDVECMDAKVGYIKPAWNWHFTVNGIDWLNKKMFDYCGLIPLELAEIAPEGMYNN